MSFQIGTLVQDGFVKLENVQTTTDGLRAFMTIYLDFQLRKSRDADNTTAINFFSIQANLLLLHGNVLLSTTTQPCSFKLFEEDVDTGASLRFMLDDAAIFAIQKFRNGEDVHLKIEYTVSALVKDAFEPIDKTIVWSAENVRYFQGQTQFIIPKSNWSEKLIRGLGHPGFKLIEIPLKHNIIKEAYSDIIDEFNQAQDYYKKGDNNKCVQHCRGALDKLNSSLKDLKNSAKSKSRLGWLEKIDEATRTWIDTMNLSTFAITSGPHHAGLKKEFTRVEAESIYLVTLGLMNFVGQASVDYQ